MKVNTKTILNYDIPYNEKLNKKVLSEKECEEVRYLFHERGYTYKMLIDMFGVSRNIIYFTLYPEKRALYNQKQREKGTKVRCNNSERCKKYRERKKELLIQGKLVQK